MVPVRLVGDEVLRDRFAIGALADYPAAIASREKRVGTVGSDE